MLSQYKSPLERCIVFNSKTTGLVYRNNMIVTSKCLELRVNSDIVVQFYYLFEWIYKDSST